MCRPGIVDRRANHPLPAISALSQNSNSAARNNTLSSMLAIIAMMPARTGVRVFWRA